MGEPWCGIPQVSGSSLGPVKVSLPLSEINCLNWNLTTIQFDSVGFTIFVYHLESNTWELCMDGDQMNW